MAFSSSPMALVKKEEQQPGAIIVGNVSSTSRLYGQQQEILIHRYSIPNAQHIYVNEGSNNSVFATHDFLSLYGGTPRYVDRHGEAASLVTKDLLQPLELKVQGTHGTGNFHVGQRESEGEKHGKNGLRAFRGDSEALQGKSTAGPTKDVVVDSSRSVAKADMAHLQRERSDNLAYWSNVQVKFGFSDLVCVPKSDSTSSSLISSQQPLSKHWLQTGQGLVEIAKNTVQVPSDDEEEEDEDCHDSRKDGNDHRLVTDNGNGKRLDSKGTTPRSKHSATEQRRRSKINDRFQMLRKLVPHSDQKRDKASFLLEVVDYVRSLQDKVRKYDSLQQGTQQERPKTMPWDSKTMKGSCSLTFPKDYSCSEKIDSLQSMELHGASKTNVIPPSSAVINSVQQNSCQDKEHATTASPNTGASPNAAAPEIPASLQTSDRNDSKLQTSPDSSQLQSASPVPQGRQNESNREQVHVMGGVINVSTVYSQGLLETLSGALQSSGLDLSQATISVHIELGKAPKEPSSKRALDSPQSSEHSQECLQQQPLAAPISCETPHKKPKLEP